ncbi:MAG: sugar phosphate isomerase/epimerase [Clostridia bacterium]|nr:sugar phosphate isomerase/epimerase [Clostridia bacterium]MBO4886030.1 sugar phosphate isomerase/epimerase [Clostridia bacterium]
MKIGVSSYSFSKYMKHTGCNYLDICNVAKEIGYDGIEFIDLKPEISGCRDDIEIARQIRAHCGTIGLEIAAYTIGANFLCEDPDAEVERVKHCVDVAVELGAPLMRHDACWGPAVKGHGYTWRDAIETIAPYIRRVTEYAATKGVKTMTENHGHFIQDPERVETLIRTVNNPNYGWLVDMGNFICADCDSLQALAVAAPYAFHVHAKDFLYKPGTQPSPGAGWFDTRGGNHIRGTIVGHGVIPVAQCVAMLKNAGYEGFLSLEFEGLEDNLTAIKAGYEYLRAIAN